MILKFLLITYRKWRRLDTIVFVKTPFSHCSGGELLLRHASNGIQRLHAWLHPEDAGRVSNKQEKNEAFIKLSKSV